MYSVPSIAVDKGLGFDFSGIADFVKNAATTGLNIYQNQMQLKQIKSMAQAGQYISLPTAGQYVGLPMSNVFPTQPTMPSRSIMMMPSGGGGMGTTTMLMIAGVVLVGGVLLFKTLK